MGCDVTVAVTPPVTSDSEYEHLRQGRGQKRRPPTGHVLSLGVISSQRFHCLIINRVAVRGRVEGKNATLSFTEDTRFKSCKQKLRYTQTFELQISVS